MDYDFGADTALNSLRYGKPENGDDGQEEAAENDFFEPAGTPADSAAAAGPVSVPITVNSQPVVLAGKSRYIVVDILDFYDFDVKTARGSRVVIKVNGGTAGFSTPVTKGDFVEMYWEG